MKILTEARYPLGMKNAALLLLAIVLTALPVSGRAAESIPAFQGDVLDETGVLSPPQKEQLLLKIRELRESKDVWMAIYFAKDLHDTTIEDLAHRVFTEWKLGREKSNNGLLFIAVPSVRKMRFEVGYGLEPILTDAWTKRLQEQTLKPYFKRSQYSEGISEAIDLIAQKASGQVTDLDEDPDEGGSVSEILWNRYKKIYRKDTAAALMIGILVFSLFCFGLMILKTLALSFLKSRTRTKVILFTIAWALGCMIYFELYLILVLILLACFFGLFIYAARNSRGRGGSGGSRSRSDGGGGWSSGSSGGSSSGGGSSGGGGSSSDW